MDKDKSSFFGGRNDPVGHAYDDGYRDALDGEPLLPNPYEGEGEKYMAAYRDGYADSKYDREA